MFPKAKQSGMDPVGLGIKLQTRKSELMAELAESAES